ncbi:S8 family serine peptidase [Haloferax sp. YSSS75]|uniref:S8 family serine peptidase n=1 Tax=Haloferax sp. YSSS75 TaxID=3388564 RepID=UPI00398D1673
MGANSFSRRSFLSGCGVGLGALVGGTGTAFARRSDRYIVGTSTPGSTRAATRAASAVSRVLDFGGIGTAVAGVFTEEALRGLRKNPNVRYIEPDGTMHAIGVDSTDGEVPWGIDRVDAEKAHASGATGAGAHVAIIDSGIDSDHPDLQGNLGAGKAFVSSRGPYAQPWDDDNGHGTHCAGTAGAVDDGTGVVGVSTQATLHAVKVLDKNGSGSYSDVAAGIKYVADQLWDVASLSLGGPPSSTIEDACRYAFERDVLLVAAAGNEGVNVEESAPATYSTVMAISATDDRDTLASWSNYGADIELAAPGVDIYSTVPGGYATYSGTSMACPHVSGAGAQLIAQGYTRDEARQRLRDTAEDIGLPSSQQGAGLLDVEAAVGGSLDPSPSVSWESPRGGESLTGTTTIRLAASDDSTANDALVVEYELDGSGTWRPASYDSSTGYYEDTWDTETADDGTHTLAARATDGDGNTSSAADIAVSVDNTSSGPTGSIDETSIAEADSRNPHAEFSIPWSAADADGNLDTVELTLTQTSPAGGAEETVFVDVSGETASGTTILTAKHDDGTGYTYDVTIAVSDTSQKTGGESVSVTENGV